MSFTWPEFEDKQVLEGHRSWTATFGSYDQRLDTCYYRVTVYDGLKQVEDFMAVVGTEFAGEDWTGPEFRNELRVRLARVAAIGRTHAE